MSSITALPFNLFLKIRLCIKKALVKLLQRLFAYHQERCVAELLGMLPGMTYTLLLKSGCCAKSFEFQPRLEWECGFGTQPGLVTSDLNKHFFPHPKIISALSLYFSKYLEGFGFLPTNFEISQVSRNIQVEGEHILLNFALFVLLLASVIHLLRDLFFFSH